MKNKTMQLVDSLQFWQENQGTDLFQNYLIQAQIQFRNNKFCDVPLASVHGQKF